MPHIDSPLQEPHPRHASATIVTTEREYIPPKPPTRNILPRGSPHKRTPIGQRAGVSAVWDRPGLEMAGEARFSREMAAARGLIGDPAQARRDSPDPGRRHDGRGHPAAIFGRRAGRAAA